MTWSRGISKVAAAVIAIIVIAAIIGGVIYYLQTAAKPRAPVTGPIKTIYIGALLPLTGSLSSYGENQKVAIELAEKEVNEWLAKIGAPFRIKILIEDTQTKPAVAYEKLRDLYARGVRVIIGPVSSAELKKIKPFADANKILVFSPSSTAVELSIPGDLIFRNCPNDLKQARAIAKTLWDLGKRVIVIMWRGDTWGDGLAKGVAEEFERLGGKAIMAVRYAPTKEEFSSEVKSLADTVSKLISEGYKPSEIAIVVLSFAEYVAIADEASKYPVLRRVMWFGSDGTANLPEVLRDPIAAEFSATVNFTNTIFAPVRSEYFEHVRNYVKRVLGREPDSYTYAAYDIVWLLTYAMIKAGSDDPVKVAEALPEVAAKYFGASGFTKLDKTGDRATADYMLVAVVKTPTGNYTWRTIGMYIAKEDKAVFGGELPSVKPPADYLVPADPKALEKLGVVKVVLTS